MYLPMNTLYLIKQVIRGEVCDIFFAGVLHSGRVQPRWAEIEKDHLNCCLFTSKTAAEQSVHLIEQLTDGKETGIAVPYAQQRWS